MKQKSKNTPPDFLALINQRAAKKKLLGRSINYFCHLL